MTSGREYWRGTPRESLAALTDEQLADEVVALRARLAAEKERAERWHTAWKERNAEALAAEARLALAERVVEAAVGLVAWCGQGAWEGEDGSPDALNKARAALAAWKEGEP